ncbi:hypothetical protein N9D31_03895, partial [Oligoflexaceae bacterium]|nr:hypothetical protein [Oligoflexaceae bacterium]
MKIPLPEVSALYVKEELQSKKFKIYTIGDQESRLLEIRAGWDFSLNDSEFTTFRDLMRERFSTCLSFSGVSCQQADKIINSDWEAIAVDGQDRRFILQEHSGLIVVLDATGRSVGEIRQSYDSIENKYKKSTGLTIGSQYRGEGVVLLRRGHLLLAYQDKPALLVEMAPRGSKALGLGPDAYLPRMSTFDWKGSSDNPVRLDYEAVKVWKISDFSKCDLNEIVYDWRQRRLLGLSKKCNKIMVLEEKKSGSGVESVLVSQEWLLPKKASGAEGLAVLPDGSW